MIEYIEETHQYIVNGILVPSVSEILKFKFPNKYKNVSEEVLSKKAKFGTRVHLATDKVDFIYVDKIDAYLEILPLYERLCVQQHLKLKKKYKIEPIIHEKIIYNKKLGYAGRLDVIGFVDSIKAIIDKKCTAKLDIDYVTWQNSFYYYGLAAKERKDIKKSFVEWLPKGELGQFKELKIISYEKIKKLVKEYKEANNESFM